MRRSRLIGLLVGAVAALLALGATSALAHGGGGIFGKTQSDLLPAAAKQLGVSEDALKKAIADDAGARIDRAVKAGRLDEDQAADLEDSLASNPRWAIGLTTATGVARNLGTTKGKLDDAFRAARKAALVAKIDQAVKDGRLDADDAADLKAKLDDVTLPGYKSGFGFGFGLGFALGHRGGFGHFGGMKGLPFSSAARPA